jgi:ATP-dependent Clp protease ATP-binding subunit ClpA
MINVDASIFSGSSIYRPYHWWEKSAVTLEKILRSPWTKWSAAGSAVCLAAFALYRQRSRLTTLDKQLAKLSSNPDDLLNLFRELAPLRGHWFYAKRWNALKTHLETHPALVEPFCERLIEYQITDPKNDWLSPTAELISSEQLCKIHKVDQKQLEELASDLAKALENPPETLETLRTTLGGYLRTSATYVGQGLHSFASTFLRAHDFASDDNNTLVQRHEARWHLTNFYELIERPVMLILSVYTFLQPKTRYAWIPYVGTLCSIVAAVSLIKFFNVFLQKKKAILSNDLRNLTEEARQGILPVTLASPDVISEMGNALSPLNKDAPSILLVGLSGIGKDAQLHAFVYAVLRGEFPLLNGIEIHTTTASQLKEFGGGTNHLYFSRLQILVRDLQSQKDGHVVFINEIHTLNPKEDQVDNRTELGQQFKTILESGQLHVIGETTLKEYEEHIKWDDALDRRFIKIFCTQSSDCVDILENTMVEKYPTVTVEREAIELALKETDKTRPLVSQPAKAKDVLVAAARYVLGNYAKPEKELITESAKLTKDRGSLGRDPTNAAKTKDVAGVSDNVQSKQTTVNDKRKELNGLADLHECRIQAQKRHVRLAHRISSQPEKSAVEQKIFLLVRRLLDKTRQAITKKEEELEKKGIDIKVDVKLIKKMLKLPP